MDVQYVDLPWLVKIRTVSTDREMVYLFLYMDVQLTMIGQSTTTGNILDSVS